MTIGPGGRRLRIRLVCATLVCLAGVTACGKSSLALAEPQAVPEFNMPQEPMPGTPLWDREPVVPQPGLAVPTEGNRFADSELLKWQPTNMLVVSAPPGDETYFVQLRDHWSGAPGPAFAISPGDTAKVAMFTGDFDLYFAAGTEWYGYEYLFGPAGSYARADEVFTFDRYMSWEVSLTLQPGGNLGQETMDYDEFVRG